MSDNQSDDLDNTRDSVLSDQSHTYSDSSDPDLIIIDFEYCAYNYRGFDLANHFIEWTMDYTNKEYPYYYHKKDQYPNNEQQVNGTHGTFDFYVLFNIFIIIGTIHSHVFDRVDVQQ